MILPKKITQILVLIFLALAVASCDDGCVDIDEFDSESVRIEANPKNDGIYGFYEPIDGGQRAEWHDTGLKSNGEEFLIQIGGSWVPWNGQNSDSNALDELDRCNFCARRTLSPNCICYQGQTPTPEEGPNGLAVNTDCTRTANQNDPTLCTCTKDPQYGSALDYGVFHYSLNYYEKDQSVKIADKQILCKYDRGMGAYIGLFGSRGVEVPLRVYHLFSLEETCNIVRDSNGKCIASNGQDLTRYVFHSANSRIFVKDDKNANDGSDTNSPDDEYHKPNEVVKVIIYDRYYSDNLGGYNLTILKGVGNAKDNGLLEFLVRMVEDVLLGQENDQGEREGGVIEFMYKAIVQDSGFILIVQISLSLYVAFYGIAHLFGLVELNKKELQGRVFKIGLIGLFTASSSWNLYNDIVVGFFKDSMDYVISVIMSMSDSNIDDSSMIKIAQLDRISDVSNSTRFSYVDLTIKKLFSNASSKKIFGLFFGTPFLGLIYIPIIYSLIGYFVYVMLFIASIYLINLIKIIFVLSLGPIFICFTLFTQTQKMFKNWLGFLGARSLEIIFLFLILYNFLALIDKNFTDLLSYRACLERWGIGPIQIKILRSYPDRSFIAWFASFITIGGLIFIMQIVVNKVGDLAASLISIGGVKGGDANDGKSSSSFGSAGGMMGQAFSAFKGAAGGAFSVGSFGGRHVIKGLTSAARASGISQALDKIGAKIPVRGLRTRARDSIIDAEINKFKAEAAAKGISGSRADLYIRNKTIDALETKMNKEPGKMALAGVDNASIAKRMDQKLIGEVAQKFMEAELKKIKDGKSGEVPLGYEAMKKEMDKRLSDWAEKNLAGGKEAFNDFMKERGLRDYLNRDYLKNNYELSTSEAAKAFADKPEGQNRYLEYLRDNEFKNKQKDQGSSVLRDSASNPKLARENFMRKLRKRENPKKSTWQSRKRRWNPLSRVNILDKALGVTNFEKYQNARIEKFSIQKELAKTADLEKRRFLEARIQEENAKIAELASKDTKVSEQKSLDESRDKRVADENEEKNRKKLEEAKAAVDENIEKAKKEIDGAVKKVDEKIEKVSKESEDIVKGDKTPEDKKEALNSIARSFTFDSSVTDILLKSPDVGLKAGNILLGADGSKKDVNEVRIKELELAATQENSKFKMAEMSHKLKELELDQLRKTDKPDSAAIAALEKEVADLAKEMKTHKNRVDEIEKESRSLIAEQKTLDEAKDKKDENEEKNRKKLEEATAARDSELKKVDEKIENAKKEIDEAIKKVDETFKKIDEEIRKVDEIVKDENKTSEQKKEALGLIATSFKIDFGASVTDILLKSPDIGLKAGNILLGADGPKKEINEVRIKELELAANQENGKLKMVKMSHKLKEFELDQLRKADKPDSVAVAALEKEVADLAKEMKNHENRVAEMERDKITLVNSSV